MSYYRGSSDGSVQLFIFGAFILFFLCAVMSSCNNRITDDIAIPQFKELFDTDNVTIERKSNDALFFGDMHDVTYQLRIDGKLVAGRCTSSTFSAPVCRPYNSNLAIETDSNQNVLIWILGFLALVGSVLFLINPYRNPKKLQGTMEEALRELPKEKHDRVLIFRQAFMGFVFLYAFAAVPVMSVSLYTLGIGPWLAHIVAASIIGLNIGLFIRDAAKIYLRPEEYSLKAKTIGGGKFAGLTPKRPVRFALLWLLVPYVWFLFLISTGIVAL